jgi:hypothetical protein
MNKQNHGQGVALTHLAALDVPASVRADLVKHLIGDSALIELVFESLHRVKALAGVLEAASDTIDGNGHIERECVAGAARIIRNEADSALILINGISKLEVTEVSHERK